MIEIFKQKHPVGQPLKKKNHDVMVLSFLKDHIWEKN